MVVAEIACRVYLVAAGVLVVVGLCCFVQQGLQDCSSRQLFRGIVTLLDKRRTQFFTLSFGKATIPTVVGVGKDHFCISGVLTPGKIRTRRWKRDFILSESAAAA